MFPAGFRVRSVKIDQFFTDQRLDEWVAALRKQDHQFSRYLQNHRNQLKFFSLSLSLPPFLLSFFLPLFLSRFNCRCDTYLVAILVQHGNCRIGYEACVMIYGKQNWRRFAGVFRARTLRHTLDSSRSLAERRLYPDAHLAIVTASIQIALLEDINIYTGSH